MLCWKRSLVPIFFSFLFLFLVASVSSFDLVIRSNRSVNVSLDEVYVGLSGYSAVYFVGLDTVTFSTQRDVRGRDYCGRYFFDNGNRNSIVLYGWDGSFPYSCLDHELGHHFEHYFLGKNLVLSEAFAKAFRPQINKFC